MEKRYLSAIIINDVSANLVYWGGIDGFSVDVKQQELIALAKQLPKKKLRRVLFGLTKRSHG